LEKTSSGNVPTTSSHAKLQGKYKPLALWVKKQRDELVAYEKESPQPGLRMTEERKELLLNLGLSQQAKAGPPSWSWERKQANFEESFKKKIDELKAYKAEHGACVQSASLLDVKIKMPCITFSDIFTFFLFCRKH
jgi:hypothetical protein